MIQRSNDGFIRYGLVRPALRPWSCQRRLRRDLVIAARVSLDFG